MKNSNILALAVGGYLAYLLLSSNKETLKINATKIRIDDIDADWQRIRIRFLIQNPTSSNWVIRALYGDLYINGDHVTTISYTGYVSVPAAGQNYLTVVGSYLVQNMGRLLFNIFNGKQTGYTFEFRGTANVNSEMIPISISFRK